VWDTLPQKLRAQILEKHLQLWVIDAYAVAAEAGMGRRINTIMQTCFFAISGILPKDEAIAAIKHAVDKTYGRKSKRLVDLNYKAIDTTLAKLHHVTPLPQAGEGSGERAVSAAQQSPLSRERAREAPDFVRDLTLPVYQGKGDRLPVSVFPVDGTYPLGTAQYEKRNIALEIPVWDADLCTQCGKCVFVCPHTAIRRACLQRRSRGRCAADPSSTCRRRARIFPPAPTSATRWRRKTAPDAAIASRPARSTTSPTSAGAP
jgi:pyruvate-ferredoxin/flavodoxin oxidoreductase